MLSVEIMSEWAHTFQMPDELSLNNFTAQNSTVNITCIEMLDAKTNQSYHENCSLFLSRHTFRHRLRNFEIHWKVRYFLDALTS